MLLSFIVFLNFWFTIKQAENILSPWTITEFYALYYNGFIYLALQKGQCFFLFFFWVGGSFLFYPTENYFNLFMEVGIFGIKYNIQSLINTQIWTSTASINRKVAMKVPTDANLNLVQSHALIEISNLYEQ